MTTAAKTINVSCLRWQADTTRSAKILEQCELGKTSASAAEADLYVVTLSQHQSHLPNAALKALYTRPMCLVVDGIQSSV